MADPTTANKALFTPAHGADPGTWDVPVNANWNNIDQALGTYTTLNVNGQSGNVALTVSQAVPLGFIISGALTANVNYVTPAAAGGFWYVRNPLAANSFNVTFSSASGGNSVLIPPQENVIISADGTTNGMVNAVTVLQAAAGPSTAVQVNNAGLLAGYPGFVYNSSAGTLSIPNIIVNGNTVLGFNSGSTVTVNGISWLMPNGFNLNAGQFQMSATGAVGIGAPPSGGALVTVGGLLNVTSGGIKYPDGTTESSALLPSLTNSLGGDVSLSNPAAYFTGPTVAQGTAGTWFASGTVTVRDTSSGNAQINVKLWDGTTLIASATQNTQANVNSPITISLSGVITNPAGNIRMDVQDSTSGSGLILWNYSGGTGKDSTVTAVRIGP